MFVDQIRIYARAGDGGNGCVSFRREKFVPKGGPDGGDGGRGGDVVLQADPHTDNLVALYYEPVIRAKRGEHGKGKAKYGKSGVSTVVKVPQGTLVYQLPRRLGPNRPPEEGEEESRPKPKINPADLELLADLTEPGEECLLCRGGAGGKGNIHFKSARNQAPQQFTDGEKGEEGCFFLELRRIADAGLVGYPNAGKSTLIGRISAAHPKVAAYPFTTLHPMVGIVEFPGYERATVADVPGLIEGAHRNVGLGYDFLRHIVRCRVLIMTIDMAGSEGRSPIDDLARLREELDLYDPALTQRPWLVVANKMDLPAAEENLEQFRARYPKVATLPVSALENRGLDEFRKKLHELLTKSS